MKGKIIWIFLIIILSFSILKPIDKKLKYIESAPYMVENYKVLVFKDKSDSLYFILTDIYFVDSLKVKNYKELISGNDYLLTLNSYPETVVIFFYIRGGRPSYDYLSFLRNDTLVGNIFSSPNIVGNYYRNNEN